MRLVALGLCLVAAACHREPAPVTFDGALTGGKIALVKHGERLIHVLGCTGCHGEQLEGTFMTKDEPQYGPIYASNLSVEVPEYSDAQLDGIIRHGVHPERKTVWAMPSQIFQHLSDPDFRALVGYLRTLKPQGKKLPPPQFSRQDRKDIASGNYEPAVQLVRETASKGPLDLGPQYALGRYITTVTCAECHGYDLKGVTGPMGKSPDLLVVGGYTRADFDKLIMQGIPTPLRKLNPMMSGVATTRFSHLTPHERDALYAYLKSRAEHQ